MKLATGFLLGAIAATLVAMGLVLISPGDSDMFSEYRIGAGVFTVYERTVEVETMPDGKQRAVATTSMKPGVIAWALSGGMAFAATQGVGIIMARVARKKM